MVKGGDPRFILQNFIFRKGEKDMSEGKKKVIRRVRESSMLKPEDRGWVPLSYIEREGREWSDDETWDKVNAGELKYAPAGGNLVVFFERAEDKEKHKHLRRYADWRYEKWERELAEMAHMPYWYDVVKEEEQRKREAEERGSWLEAALGGIFGFVGEVLMVLWNIIAVICCILFLRNAAQWFLGTGAYGKGCECE